MKLKLHKSLIRDKKIFKIITNLYPQRIQKKFIFNVRISKKKYLNMIKNRYISTLIPLSKKQLIQGIQEIELEINKLSNHLLLLDILNMNYFLIYNLDIQI